MLGASGSLSTPLSAKNEPSNRVISDGSAATEQASQRFPMVPAMYQQMSLYPSTWMNIAHMMTAPPSGLPLQSPGSHPNGLTSPSMGMMAVAESPFMRQMVSGLNPLQFNAHPQHLQLIAQMQHAQWQRQLLASLLQQSNQQQNHVVDSAAGLPTVRPGSTGLSPMYMMGSHSSATRPSPDVALKTNSSYKGSAEAGPRAPQRTASTGHAGHGHKPVDKNLVKRRKKAVLKFQQRLKDFKGPDLCAELIRFTTDHPLLWTSAPPSLRFRVHHVQPFASSDQYVNDEKMGSGGETGLEELSADGKAMKRRRVRPSRLGDRTEAPPSPVSASSSEDVLDIETTKDSVLQPSPVTSTSSNSIMFQALAHNSSPVSLPEEDKSVPPAVHYIHLSENPSRNALYKRMFARFTSHDNIHMNSDNSMSSGVLDLEVRNVTARQAEKIRDRDVIILKRIVGQKLVFCDKERTIKLSVAYAHRKEHDADASTAAAASSGARPATMESTLVYEASANCRTGVIMLYLMPAAGSVLSLRLTALKPSAKSVLSAPQPSMYSLNTLKVNNNKLVPAEEIQVLKDFDADDTAQPHSVHRSVVPTLAMSSALASAVWEAASGQRQQGSKRKRSSDSLSQSADSGGDDDDEHGGDHEEDHMQGPDDGDDEEGEEEEMGQEDAIRSSGRTSTPAAARPGLDAVALLLDVANGSDHEDSKSGEPATERKSAI